jgi:hypothetical protein
VLIAVDHVRRLLKDCASGPGFSGLQETRHEDHLLFQDALVQYDSTEPRLAVFLGGDYASTPWIGSVSDL